MASRSTRNKANKKEETPIKDKTKLDSVPHQPVKASTSDIYGTSNKIKRSNGTHGIKSTETRMSKLSARDLNIEKSLIDKNNLKVTKRSTANYGLINTVSSDESIKEVSTRNKTSKNVISNKTNTKIIQPKTAKSITEPKKSTEQSTNKIRKISAVKQYKTDVTYPKKTARLAKDLPFVGVVVNSPPNERKLNKVYSKLDLSKESSVTRQQREKKMQSVEKNDRERSKTKTLSDEEVKVLEVDNNEEMKKLSFKLTAKPKAFFVDLNDKAKDEVEKLKSESDYSYEDDFESYESDFESYHSESSRNADSAVNNQSQDDKMSETSSNASTSQYGKRSEKALVNEMREEVKEHICSTNPTNSNESFKEKHIDEIRLDSGNFELREIQKSATKIRSAMDFIDEETESARENTQSLHDEGFLEMPSSVGVRSLEKMDNNDSNNFIDFAKSTETKRRRLLLEQRNKRAQDLMNMISLHEVSYILFDIKPIPYETYMSVFGNDNCKQIAVQTFDDGVDKEIQTEEVTVETKWTQHPIQFSNHEVHIGDSVKSIDDKEEAFQFLFNNETNLNDHSEEYKNNKLKIYLEQKHGVGCDKQFPKITYDKLTKNPQFNLQRLKIFLRSKEKITLKILNREKHLNTTKKTDWVFSEGYLSIKANYTEENTNITSVKFSETSNEYLISIHDCQIESKLCLWDLTAVETEVRPIKILRVSDKIIHCKFRGDEDGLVAAATESASLHLWDLSETVDRRRIIADEESSIHGGSCSYTSSGLSVVEECAGQAGGVSALEFFAFSPDGTREGEIVVGQICSLHLYGQIVIWIILKDQRQTREDIGQAYWSKIRLKRSQVINLTEFVDIPLIGNTDFNLATIKRRISLRSKKPPPFCKSKRPPSCKSIDYDFMDEEEGSVSTHRKDAVVAWDCGLVCADLKIVCGDGVEKYYIGRNCGQVLCCDQRGDVKVTKYQVARDTSTVSCLQLSSALSVLLAGCEGCVSLLSLSEARILLTLDCTVPSPMNGLELTVGSLLWPRRQPCTVLVLLAGGELCLWQLARTDIAPAWRHRADIVAADLSASSDGLALLMSSGEIQVHQLSRDSSFDQNRLFANYLSLL